MNDPVDAGAKRRAVEMAQAFLLRETGSLSVLLDAHPDREQGPGFWVVMFEPETSGKFDPGLTMVEVNLLTGEACFFAAL